MLSAGNFLTTTNNVGQAHCSNRSSAAKLAFQPYPAAGHDAPGGYDLGPQCPECPRRSCIFSKTRPLAVPAPARLDRLAAGGGTADAFTVSGAGAGGFVSPLTCALCRRLGLATTFLTIVADPRLAGLSRLPFRLFPARLHLSDMPILVVGESGCDLSHAFVV